jgi:hypothetical protein
MENVSTPGAGPHGRMSEAMVENSALSLGESAIKFGSPGTEAPVKASQRCAEEVVLILPVHRTEVPQRLYYGASAVVVFPQQGAPRACSISLSLRRSAFQILTCMR